jgi:hypothetical protein
LHDLKKLIRTDVVFSRTTMVLFLCRNKKFSDWAENLRRIFPEYIKIIGEKIYWRGPPMSSWVPQTSVFPNSNSIKTVSWRKNQREEIITFYDTEPPPPVLHREG